ncbi:hypothetical protein [Pseudomarimonas arenosa]|uniref:Uncharacterized protein n=1 Tax=Pseudomarimonas arenosa TaxID=2774145 RepID=A0AAW3ZMX0_9GAMM|nr:hypothetical protein [Pseudomarimonas arenosa]MBD8525982.1 hypothetical protein [Pseudomarimonas arenosa]
MSSVPQDRCTASAATPISGLEALPLGFCGDVLSERECSCPIEHAQRARAAPAHAAHAAVRGECAPARIAPALAVQAARWRSVGE